MTVYLSRQLKKLRRERGNTQEDLAAHLGITVQAVSKWERGEGYPDITLLPAIASYYNVSIDDLLGVGQIEKEKKLNEYVDRDHKYWQEGRIAESLKLWREAQKEFPNEIKVLFGLMYDLLYNDGNCGFYHERYMEFCEGMAAQYRKLGDEAEMFRCLEKAAEHAIRFDGEEDVPYTAFMVNRLKRSVENEVKNYEENDSDLLLKHLLGKTYDPWRGDERLGRIIESLRVAAKG